jgi:hypothetical protein
VDARRGEALVAGEDPGERLALFLPRHEKCDERLRVQVRKREAEPRMRGLQTRHGDVHERARVGELLLVAREERGRVAVGAEAEEDEVERARKVDVGRAQRVDLLLGNRYAGEQGLAGEALVRVGMVRRDEAVVAPPDVPGRPVEVELRQPLVDRPRRRPARERDAERRAAARTLGDPAGAEFRQVGAYEKLRTASS